MAVSALAKPDLVLVTYSVPMCSRVPTHPFVIMSYICKQGLLFTPRQGSTETATEDN